MLPLLLIVPSALLAAEPSEVRVEKDIAYLPADRAGKADLYLPAEDPAKHPGVVIIHGGGWSGGDKGAAREDNIGRTLAAHGYVCMSINYLLADPKAQKPAWPQNLYDCKTAVRWLRANAERLHLDPDHIGAIGGSAGGHLATMLDVTRPQDGLDPSGPTASSPAASPAPWICMARWISRTGRTSPRSARPARKRPNSTSRFPP
jgi:acetyl esterase/lipase